MGYCFIIGFYMEGVYSILADGESRQALDELEQKTKEMGGVAGIN